MAKLPTPATVSGKIREVALFVIGAGGFAYEAIIAPEPRVVLIGPYLLMLGIPVLGLVERLFQVPGRDQQKPPPEPPSQDESKDRVA